MAAINSLLFLFATVAPYTENPENAPVTYPITELNPVTVRSLSRDDDPINLFPDKKCPPYEWYTCSSHCQRRCEKSWWPCPGWCVPGCECMPPRVRGPEGNCIHPYECPNAIKVPEFDETEEDCGDDEEMSCYSHCEKNCTNFDRNIHCSSYCVKGCVCKEPKIRGPDGRCILPEYCPSSQRLTSVTQCSDPEGCSENDESDYSKNIIEHSETREDCPENEIYDNCGTACEKNCTTYNMEDQVCPHERCVSGCFCQPGYVRGPTGKCVLPYECWMRAPQSVGYIDSPSTVRSYPYDIHEDALVIDDYDYDTNGGEYICPENQVYKLCGSACPRDCSNYDKPMDCLPVCVPGCFCKGSMILGPGGKCIREVECPNHPDRLKNPQSYSESTTESSNDTCPENQEYKVCGTPCIKNCFNVDKPAPCPDVCVSGCFCKDPMIQGPNGDCIYRHECPRPLSARTGLHITCREDEEYRDCDRNCADDESCECAPGCYCKHPLLRGPDGSCRVKGASELSPFHQTVLAPALCPPDQEYLFCGTACVKTCSNYNKKTPCIEFCSQGCFCKEPKIVGPDGKCVFVEECPPETTGSSAPLRQGFFPHLPTLKCKENEEFSMCASMCPDNCHNYDTDRLCKKMCLPGCKCKDGYVLNEEGTCIKREQCTEQKPSDCSDLEFYDECGTHCETDCFNYLLPNRTCEETGCKKGCYCKPGLVRSADWKCVTPQTCLTKN